MSQPIKRSGRRFYYLLSDPECSTLQQFTCSQPISANDTSSSSIPFVFVQNTNISKKGNPTSGLLCAFLSDNEWVLGAIIMQTISQTFIVKVSIDSIDHKNNIKVCCIHCIFHLMHYTLS